MVACFFLYLLSMEAASSADTVASSWLENAMLICSQLVYYEHCCKVHRRHVYFYPFVLISSAVFSTGSIDGNIFIWDRRKKCKGDTGSHVGAVKNAHTCRSLGGTKRSRKAGPALVRMFLSPKNINVIKRNYTDRNNRKKVNWLCLILYFYMYKMVLPQCYELQCPYWFFSLGQPRECNIGDISRWTFALILWQQGRVSAVT